jgi:hypothetical protein
MYSPVEVASRETLSSPVLLSCVVDAAQELGIHGSLQTLPGICFCQVLRHHLRRTRAYIDSALFGLSYLTALVLSHLSPHAIEVAQIFDHVRHSGDLLEAQPVERQEVDESGMKTLQENLFPDEVASKDCKNLHLPSYLMHTFTFYGFDHYAPRLGKTRHCAKLHAQSLLERQGNSRNQSAAVEISQNTDIGSRHLQPPGTTEQRTLRRSFYEFVPLPVFL